MLNSSWTEVIKIPIETYNISSHLCRRRINGKKKHEYFFVAFYFEIKVYLTFKTINATLIQHIQKQQVAVKYIFVLGQDLVKLCHTSLIFLYDRFELQAASFQGLRDPECESWQAVYFHSNVFILLKS